ncbi:hypothetical protein [Streptomyces sp. NBC_01477]|uniref:hypothetical protein n=1 Tax=Streptomyces sp. NBC_01477 TaxID=2976015 RepID=UPI002E362A90|nr:hypothetical protein [Streptomyces sp. NBC_01477]
MTSHRSGPRHGGQRQGSQRRIPRPHGVAPAALRELKDCVYRLYAEAGTPPVAHIASEIEKDDSFRGSPSKDTVHRIIGSPDLLAGQEDVVAVAVLLAREAGRDTREVGDRVRRLWVDAQLAEHLGTPVRDLDPLALEVHQAISVPGQETLPELPLYVERDHDAALSEVVSRAAAGESVLATLVGESSTGKTRSCWEALRGLPEGWRVWHPFDPTRPEAALVHLAEVGPRTVIWLNEAQHYLLAPDPRVAERVTSALRTALTEPRRGPVLVLATVWPRYWDPLTTRPAPGAEDRYEQQRTLLTDLGRRIPVPKAFTERDLHQAERKAAADPRLASALKGASDGEITQFLAGVPELLSRYACAPHQAKALIHAAMDFRRLGHGPALPRTLLAQAAEGYLTDHELVCLDSDWLDRALAFCGTPCNGVPGPLTPIPGRSNDTGGTAYRLADYLEQQGRVDRRLLCPPVSFWEAAARHCGGSEECAALARAAGSRGRLRAAAALYRKAFEFGNTDVRAPLAELLEGTGRLAEAKELYEAEMKADGWARWELIRLREMAGEPVGAEGLAHLAAEQGLTNALSRLAQLRVKAGDALGAETVIRNSAARGRVGTFAELARSREGVGDRAQAELVVFSALDASGSTYALSEVARIRERSGDGGAAEQLVRAAALRGRTRPAILLAWMRQRTGTDPSAAGLLEAAARAGSVFALTELARLRKKAGDSAAAERLLHEAAAKGSLFALTELARLREKAGDADGALRYYRTAAAKGSTEALAHLALLREGAGASEEAERMACAAADAGSTFALLELVWLREKSEDRRGAERLADTAVGAGNTGALTLLARLREDAGDSAGAERLVLRAARTGYLLALDDFVLRREKAGDAEGAERMALAGGDKSVVRLARLREAAGDPVDAERLYRCAAGLGSTEALLNLARLSEEAGRPEAAEEFARSAAQAGQVEAFSELAHARARRGLFQDADRLHLAAADAGHDKALAHLAELRTSWDPVWADLPRYGLLDNGEMARPW